MFTVREVSNRPLLLRIHPTPMDNYFCFQNKPNLTPSPDPEVKRRQCLHVRARAGRLLRYAQVQVFIKSPNGGSCCRRVFRPGVGCLSPRPPSSRLPSSSPCTPSPLPPLLSPPSPPFSPLPFPLPLYSPLTAFSYLTQLYHAALRSSSQPPLDSPLTI